MSPEERALLERTYKLAEENNEMLRALRRMNRWSTVLRFSYWLIIIVLSFGAYYFIQPYLEQAQDLYSGVTGNIDQVKSYAETFRELTQ
jgi:hypothetical protein